MITRDAQVHYILLQDEQRFHSLANSFLMKNSYVPLDLPVYRCISSKEREGLRDNIEIITVDNDYTAGWEFVMANKYYALLKMPESIGQGYVHCRLIDFCALTTQGPIKTQELCWLTEDGRYTRIANRTVVESSEMRPYTSQGHTLNAQELTADHVGLFVKGTRGKTIIHSVVGYDTRYNPPHVRVLGRQANHYRCSSQWEVVEGAVLSERGVQQFKKWQEEDAPVHFSMCSLAEATAATELFVPDIFAKVVQCGWMELYLVGSSAENTVFSAGARNISLPKEWYISEGTMLPLSAENSQNENFGQDDTNWKKVVPLGNAGVNRQYFLKMGITEAKAGVKLKIEFETNDELPTVRKHFKSYTCSSWEAAAHLMTHIILKNNFKVCVTLYPQQGQGFSVAFPPSVQRSYHLRSLLSRK